MAQRPTYATREQVMTRMDIQLTAYAARRVDDALQTWSRVIEKRCQRPGGLFPALRTLAMDWPDVSQRTSWRLRVGPDELISLVSLSSGGTAITGSLLRAGDGTSTGTGPPYNQIQLDRSTSAAFGGGSTPQANISAVVWTGITDDQAPAGTLAVAVASTSATTITVTDGSLVGVGNQLVIDSERLIVTDRAMTTTAQTLAGNIAADKAIVTVPVSSGAAFAPFETILIDSERMLIVDVSGNNLTVKRSWDGSVLAAHTSGATVYSPRLLTVVRGACGSTAATHLISTAIYRWLPPPEIQSLCIGESLNLLQQESSGFARQIGSGEFAREVSARGLKDLRDQVYNSSLRRRARAWAV
jgi:hypothetical protein